MHRARHGACHMEGRLQVELWAVVLRSRLDDFIGLTEHRSQRGECVNSVHGTFAAACAVQNSEVIVHHSRGGSMSVRCVYPVTAIVG
jgi:hypothetical protein